MKFSDNIDMNEILEKINEKTNFNEIENSYNRIVLTDFLHFCFKKGDEISVFLESYNEKEKNYCIGISLSRKSNPNITIDLKRFILKLPKYKTTFSCILNCTDKIKSTTTSTTANTIIKQNVTEPEDITIYIYFQRTSDKDEIVTPNLPRLLTNNTFKNLTKEFEVFSITSQEEQAFRHLYSILTNLDCFQPRVRTELTLDSKATKYVSLSFYPIISLHLHHLVDFVKTYENITESVQFNLKKIKEKGEERYYPCYTFTFKRIDQTVTYDNQNQNDKKKRLFSNQYNENTDYSDDDDHDDIDQQDFNSNNNNNNKRIKK